MANSLNKVTTKSILDATIATADIADDAVTADKLANAINTDIAAKMPLAGGTFTGDITIPDKIIHDGDTNTALRFPAADTITAETGGSERVRIDSSGRVLIGTTTEGEASVDNLTVSSSGDTGITVRSGTTSNGAITFSDGTSGADEYRGMIDYDHDTDFLRLYTNATEKLRLESGGNVKINDGDLVIGTSGHGIDFSATSGSNAGATASVLDDYEEGAWTPNWRGASTAGTTTYASGGNVATYTKIGRQVNVGGYTNITAYTGSGILIIDNLPFASPVGDSHLRTGSVFCNTINLESDHMWLVTYAAGGSTMKLYATRDNLGWEPLYMESGAFIWSLTYHTT